MDADRVAMHAHLDLVTYHNTLSEKEWARNGKQDGENMNTQVVCMSSRLSQ